MLKIPLAALVVPTTASKLWSSLINMSCGYIPFATFPRHSRFGIFVQYSLKAQASCYHVFATTIALALQSNNIFSNGECLLPEKLKVMLEVPQWVGLSHSLK
jgi:hypothetical protein